MAKGQAHPKSEQVKGKGGKTTAKKADAAPKETAEEKAARKAKEAEAKAAEEAKARAEKDKALEGEIVDAKLPSLYQGDDKVNVLNTVQLNFDNMNWDECVKNFKAGADGAKLSYVFTVGTFMRAKDIFKSENGGKAYGFINKFVEATGKSRGYIEQLSMIANRPDVLAKARTHAEALFMISNKDKTLTFETHLKQKKEKAASKSGKVTAVKHDPNIETIDSLDTDAQDVVARYLKFIEVTDYVQQLDADERGRVDEAIMTLQSSLSDLRELLAKPTAMPEQATEQPAAAAE